MVRNIDSLIWYFSFLAALIALLVTQFDSISKKDEDNMEDENNSDDGVNVTIDIDVGEIMQDINNSPWCQPLYL